jgi:hypothetical protein
MKKRLISYLLTIAIVVSASISTMPSASAATSALSSAYNLYKLGLFKGAGTNADGTPDFALDRAPTRAEAVVMLIRLIGKEKEAKNGSFKHPFSDVEDWANPYVGYAYTKGLSKGTSDTTYGSNDTISAPQFITLVLRALSYSSATDFQWDTSFKFSDSIGLTDGTYNGDSIFLRGDAAIVSYNALLQKPKGTTRSLLSYLFASNSVTSYAINSLGLSNLLNKYAIGGSEKAYAGSALVPDFGAYFGVASVDRKAANDKYTNYYYFYNLQDANAIDANALTDYSTLLKKIGYVNMRSFSVSLDEGSYSGDNYSNGYLDVLVGTVEVSSTASNRVSKQICITLILNNSSVSSKYPKTEKGYNDYSTLPDFGAYFGVSLKEKNTDSNKSNYYYYLLSDVTAVDITAISDYGTLLKKWGFTYDKPFIYSGMGVCGELYTNGTSGVLIGIQTGSSGSKRIVIVSIP